MSGRSDEQFDVKLGRGGIREIEFIAQALQLAHGGRDRWLRAGAHAHQPVATRGPRVFDETELTGLFKAYDFLRHLEHILQMENGLQTHSIPNDPARRELIAKRMGCASLAEFEKSVRMKTENVHQDICASFRREGGKRIKGGRCGRVR